VVPVLLQQLLLDRRLDLRERRQLRRLDRAERLDDVVTELRVDRMRDLTGLHQERGLVERRDGLTFRNRQLAALVLRAWILRILLRELGEVRAVLNLRVQLVRERLTLDEDVRDHALLGNAVL